MDLTLFALAGLSKGFCLEILSSGAFCGRWLAFFFFGSLVFWHGAMVCIWFFGGGCG